MSGVRGFIRALAAFVSLSVSMLLMGWIFRVNAKGWDVDYRDLMTMYYYASALLLSGIAALSTKTTGA